MIGNGNVALDVARMLALTPEELAPTDTTDAAIEAINGGRDPRDPRRRPARAGAGGVDARRGGRARRARRGRHPRRPGRARARPGERGRARGGAADGEAERRAPPRRTRQRAPVGQAARDPAPLPRARPVAILGDAKVEAIELVRNELVDGRAVATDDDRDASPCGIVFRSVGYRGVELPGVPFDEGSGTIPNEGGRVSATAARSRALLRRLDQARPERRHRDEQEGRDRDGRARCSRTRAPGVLPEADRARTSRSSSSERGVDHVMYAGWEAIDAHRARGRRAARAGRASSSAPGTSCSRPPGTAARLTRRGAVARLAAVSGTARAAGALGRRDGQGGRQLPRLRRADPGRGRALARPDQGRCRARERRPRPARRRRRAAHRRGGRPDRRRRVRRPVPDRRLPDRAPGRART